MSTSLVGFGSMKWRKLSQVIGDVPELYSVRRTGCKSTRAAPKHIWCLHRRNIQGTAPDVKLIPSKPNWLIQGSKQDSSPVLMYSRQCFVAVDNPCQTRQCDTHSPGCTTFLAFLRGARDPHLALFPHDWTLTSNFSFLFLFYFSFFLDGSLFLNTAVNPGA